MKVLEKENKMGSSCLYLKNTESNQFVHLGGKIEFFTKPCRQIHVLYLSMEHVVVVWSNWSSIHYLVKTDSSRESVSYVRSNDPKFQGEQEFWSAAFLRASHSMHRKDSKCFWNDLCTAKGSWVRPRRCPLPCAVDALRILNSHWGNRLLEHTRASKRQQTYSCTNLWQL